MFAGKGSSHSWTWMADLLERIGDYDARFLQAEEFLDSLGRGTEIAVVSGGDGYAIGESFRGSGFARLKEFISSGGSYVGICAGAYLPLPSRVKPFDEFNISATKIENLDCSNQLEEIPRVSVRYGNCSIIHPVRGDVEISANDFKTHAPLYGGPIFKEPESDTVLLRYVGFGVGTEFQIERDKAEAMVLGRPAAIECRYNDGRLFLFGPHLEHPKYPEANRLLQELLGFIPGPKRVAREPKSVPPTLAKSVADLKVAAAGLEGRSFMVGRKLWDAGRFLELIRAIEKRAWCLGPEDLETIRSNLDVSRGILLKTTVGVESDIDEATVLLVESARLCVDSHFRSMVAGR